MGIRGRIYRKMRTSSRSNPLLRAAIDSTNRQTNLTIPSVFVTIYTIPLHLSIEPLALLTYQQVEQVAWRSVVELISLAILANRIVIGRNAS